MVASVGREKQNLTQAKVAKAWFGSTADFPLQYGLWLTFELPNGGEHTTAAITISLQHQWSVAEKTQIAGAMFLRIARLLYKAKVLSVEGLVGKRAYLDLYGGNCLRDFEISSGDG